MSQYTELCGVAYAKPGITIDQVRAKIIETTGKENTEMYFPYNDVLDNRDKTFITINFSSIPPEGLDTSLIEPVLQAIAPLVDDCEIECVSGMNWNDATLYRLINDRVDIATAALTPCSEWTPLSEARAKRHPFRLLLSHRR